MRCGELQKEEIFVNKKTNTNVFEYLDESSCKIKGSAMASILASDIDEAKLTIEPAYIHDLKENFINSERFKLNVQIHLPVRCLSACGSPAQAGTQTDIIKAQISKLLPKFTIQGS